ncbi:MFS transporter [Cohnella sp. CFH 77786]|uniref:MFS transporter n=1 Tax=Cohnella sp. CFH 77786 TaxID=2662265 RepID=UPI001C60DD98|nr:MFS transporter [Cohnella sp. CFH 77786]MBW5445462.1 MFS transporter [Cohnella sp. CFH 77786]
MKIAPAKSLLRSDMLLYVLILFLVEFVRGAALISFLSLYGTKRLGLDLDVIGAAITASFVTDTAVKLAMGYLLDRFPIRTVVNASLLLSFAGMALIGVADAPWLFIAASGLFGFGLSPIWIVCLTRVREESRGMQMGVLYTIWLIGLGTGPVITNLVIDVSLGAAFWMLAAISLAAWMLSFALSSRRQMHIERVPFIRQLSILGSRLREMKVLLPGMVLQTLGAGMLLPILPTFASNDLGITSTHYSVLLTVGGAFTAIGLIPMGKLADHFGKKWFLVVGFLMFGVVLYLLTLKPSYGLALFWAFVLGASYAAVLPAWNALLAAYVPPGQQGLGWGVFSTVEGLGGVIGPYVGGLLATLLSEAWVVGVAGALFMLISLFYVFFPFHSLRGEKRLSS